MEKNKEISNNDLAEMMKALTGEVRQIAVETKQNSTDIKALAEITKQNSTDIKALAKSVEDLAGMTKRGFDEVYKKIADVRDELRSEIRILQRDQDDIKIRQDNSAYRFELTAQEKTLEKHDQRIEVLEKRVLAS